MTTSRSKLATVSAEVYVTAAVGADGMQEPNTEAAFSPIMVTSLDPLAPEIRETLRLNTPHELLQCFYYGSQVLTDKMELGVGGQKYPIVSIGEWEVRDQIEYHLVLEDLSR